MAYNVYNFSPFLQTQPFVEYKAQQTSQDKNGFSIVNFACPILLKTPILPVTFRSEFNPNPFLQYRSRAPLQIIDDEKEISELFSNTLENQSMQYPAMQHPPLLHPAIQHPAIGFTHFNVQRLDQFPNFPSVIIQNDSNNDETKIFTEPKVKRS